MPCGVFSKKALFPAAHAIARNSSHRLVNSARPSSTLAIPTADEVELTPDVGSSSWPRTFLKERRLHELSESLSRGAKPSRVWSYYTSLLNVLGHEKLPVEVHQQVLRKCTPSAYELRVAAARRIEAGNKPASPHMHEGRFQTVIRNIRATDTKPSLDDYHFILEQFAAVGHHVGAVYVYKELVHLGIAPMPKTYGLCFQAIAHRLTLPIAKINRLRRTLQTRKMITDLMADMQEFSIPLTSVNLDLALRILKETTDMENFEALMKLGYGIDLSNPDRPPLEQLGTGTISSDLGISEQTVSGLPTSQPFSTAALNTTIDTIGRFGDVSKLVQAFEVLTQPLPQANQHLFTSFDDEDDFGVADSPVTPVVAPHAPPNTTTYNMLLRHLCRNGHAILARHYLNEAMVLERKTEKLVKLSTRSKRPFPAPHFAINRGTLLSVFGESNRDKNVGLMRWLATKIPRIIRNKRKDLKFYENHKQVMSRWMEKQRLAIENGNPASEESNFSDHRLSELAPQPTDPAPALTNSTPQPATPSAFRSTKSLSSKKITPVSQRKPWIDVSKYFSVFDVDLDASPASAPPPAPMKYFDIDLHISILERDISEIEQFSKHVEGILGRTTQRLKERLGRRVWAGKDIYLLTDGGKRRRVTKEHWEEIVRFQPRQPGNQFTRSFPPARDTSTPGSNRAFSTSTQSIAGTLGMANLEFHPPSTSILSQLSSIFRRN